MFGLDRKEKVRVPDEVSTFFQRVAALEARVTSLELSNDAFRDKVLRKIQDRLAKPEEAEKLKPSAGQRVRR